MGSYFTKEIDAARTSIVVVRSADQQVRAFHNICRHRGNKLVWQDYPGEETSGTARQFTCKYHGWRYSLEGDLTFVQQESEFFDLDKDDYGLAPVRVETWAVTAAVMSEMERVILRRSCRRRSPWAL